MRSQESTTQWLPSHKSCMPIQWCPGALLVARMHYLNQTEGVGVYMPSNPPAGVVV